MDERTPPRAANAVASPAASYDVWRIAAQAATVGMFLLAFGAFLSIARGLVMPLVAATVVGLLLSPLARRARSYGLPPIVFALLIVVVIVAVVNFATMALSGPIATLVAQAPDFGATLKDKLAVLEPMINRLRDLQSTLVPNADGGLHVDIAGTLRDLLVFLTPAIGELLLFVVTLFLFLLSHDSLRRKFILIFPENDDRLATIRIINDVEEKLTQYFGLVTTINFALGAAVALGCWIIGFPHPILLGVLTMVCNYVPYIGACVTMATLFVVGLFVFPSLSQALIAPPMFLAMVIFEGQFITPNIVGRRFTVNPLMVFVSLAFWTWLWGPVGGFLSVPFLVIGLAIVTHLFPKVAIPG